MKASEIEPIITYLIEDYFENNGGRVDYDMKEVSVCCLNRPDFVCVEWEWECGIHKRGGTVRSSEKFDFVDGEKITNLEAYVGEVIDRILKEPYFDERPQHTDPSVGY